MGEPVVAGIRVTVEDLSLGFLYWPDALLLGKETVRTRPAWKIELRPGKRGSEFAIVRVWLDEASGALLRIEGFDWQGHLSRRFEVVSGQRIDGLWMLVYQAKAQQLLWTGANPDPLRMRFAAERELARRGR